MIRTRDFLLYVLSLVFLVSAIGYTVAGDRTAVSYEVPDDLAFAPNSASAYGAVVAEPEENRETYIAAMREKIAQGLGKIDGAPVVLSSVDSVSAPTFAAGDSSRDIFWCDVPERIDDVVAAWRQGPVLLEDHGSTRAAVQTLPSTDPTASPTRTLLELSKPVARAPHDTCLAHDIIGVGVGGTLIANHEMWRFAGMGEGTIVGYALDGHPIITGYVDEGMLDTCGGMDTGDGYAYRLRAGSDHLLGCFAGTPAQFVR